MKKILITLLSILLLSGCSSESKNKTELENNAGNKLIVEQVETLKVLSPTGAPSLALLDLFESKIKDNIVTVDGSDVLQAAFVNPDPEYDVILAPTNLGAKLASLNKTEYRLAAIVSWGNLFLVGSDEADLQDSSKKLAAFGETAVPGLVFNAVKEFLSIEAEIIWYASVQEAQAALLSGNADAALIAEPAVTAVIAKAKNDLNLNFKRIGDIQTAWQEKTGFSGYPQASVFVLKSAYEEKPEEIEILLNRINSTLEYGNDSTNAEAVAAQVDRIGTDILGTPAGKVVSNAYSGMNLKFAEATAAKKEIQAFLELFGISEIDGIFLK